MRVFAFSAFALLGLTAAAPAARADIVVRDHRLDTVVRVRVAPPAIRTEVRVAAPSPQHSWVPGYWGWEGTRHVWVGGRWEIPPAAGQVWIEPRWVNEGGEWVFYPGRWNAPQAVMPPGTVVVPSGPAPQPVYVQPAPQPVYVQPAPQPVVVQPAPQPVYEEREWHVDVAPPPPRAEQPPPPPGPGYMWVGGYWGWSGREHVWIGGHWEVERRGEMWVPGHWEHHGHDWWWRPGHWQRRGWHGHGRGREDRD
jgi:hypothetical protein